MPGDQPKDAGWLPAKWPMKLRPRVDFSPRVFYEALANLGQRVLWESVSRCPCGAVGGNAPSLTCSICNGTGWEIGHHKQVVRAVVTSLNRMQEPYNIVGPFEPGTVSMTVRAEHAPSFWDRMTLLDAFMRFQEIATRQNATQQRLRYYIAAQTVSTVDPDTGQESEVTLKVIHLRKGTEQQAGDTLIEGQDFSVTDDGLIDWTLGDDAGTAPVPGEQFSVYYVARPSFRVVSFPHAVRDSRGRYKSPDDYPIYLPVNFLCRLEHLQKEPPS